MTGKSVLLSLSALFLIGACAQAEHGGRTPMAVKESAMLVGLAVEDVTPSWPTYLSSSGRAVLVSASYSDLEVMAMAIRSGGEAVVIVTADTMGFCDEVSDRIYDQVRSLGFLPHQIVLNASHSHTVPAICDVHDVLDVGATPIERYQTFFVEKVVSAIRQAVENMRPAILGVSEAEADICVNWDGPPYTPGFIIPNPEGLVDPRVRVLQVRDPEDARLRAILTLFGCHLSDVALEPGREAFGAEFFGFGRDYIKDHYPGLVVLTAQGAGGDSSPAHFADPVDTGGAAIKRGFQRTYPSELSPNIEFGERFGDAVLRALESDMTPVAGPIRSAMSSVDLPVEQPDSHEFVAAAARGEAVPDNQPELRGNPWYRRWAAWMLSRYEEGGPFPDTVGPYDIRLIRFGDDFSLVAFNSEVQACVGLKTEERLAPTPTFVLGYSNNTTAYIPCAENFAPPQNGGGYPISVYYWWLWQPARFQPSVDSVIVEETVALARLVAVQ